MDDDRRERYGRRAAQARELAAAAEDERVRGIHLEMARRYDLLLAGDVDPPVEDEVD